MRTTAVCVAMPLSLPFIVGGALYAYAKTAFLSGYDAAIATARHLTGDG